MSVPLTVLNHLFIRKLCTFAGYTLIVYDYLLTFSLEVEYIWGAQWTIVKILFLVIRYGNLIGQTFIMLEESGYLNVTHKFCVVFTLFNPFFVISTGETIRLLIVMRTCAILGCKRITAVTWNTLYVLYALVVFAVVLYFFFRFGPPPFLYLDEIGVCFPPVPPNLWTIVLVTLVFDSFIIVLVYYSLHRMDKGRRYAYPSRLIRLLARDAILFYIAALFNNLFCIVSWTIWSEDPRNVLQQMISMPLLIIMGQRLILNLRSHHAKSGLTSDLSREVERQVRGMETDEEQTDPSIPQSDGLGRDLHVEHKADQC